MEKKNCKLCGCSNREKGEKICQNCKETYPAARECQSCKRIYPDAEKFVPENNLLCEPCTQRRLQRKKMAKTKRCMGKIIKTVTTKKEAKKSGEKSSTSKDEAKEKQGDHYKHLVLKIGDETVCVIKLEKA